MPPLPTGRTGNNLGSRSPRALEPTLTSSPFAWCHDDMWGPWCLARHDGAHPVSLIERLVGCKTGRVQNRCSRIWDPLRRILRYLRPFLLFSSFWLHGETTDTAVLTLKQWYPQQLRHPAEVGTCRTWRYGLQCEYIGRTSLGQAENGHVRETGYIRDHCAAPFPKGTWPESHTNGNPSKQFSRYVTVNTNHPQSTSYI